MGLANLVSSAYPVPGVAMTLIAQTGDPQSGPAGDKYTGLDRFGRLVDKRWIKTGTSNPIVDLVRAQYTYDRASNRLNHTNPVATAAGVNLDQSYSYDGLYQVATHQTGIGTGIPATEEQFTYDPTGNWNRYKALAAGAVTEDTPRTNNSANQITQIAGTPELIAHNATGNTTRIPTPADPTKSFDLKWDAWNRLVKISDSETGNPVAVYTYDGLYRRISTDDGNGTDTRRYYYNQQWRCVEEFNGEDSAEKKLMKRYFWGAQNRWELIARQRDTDGNETLDEELFVLTDAMDPVAIVNSSGNVEERYSYSAFGETTIINSGFVEKNETDFDWNYRFHGEFQDDSRLYNYGYRYYQSELGRWLSRDPISYFSPTNSYCFLRNRPTKYWDALGLKEIVFVDKPPSMIEDLITDEQWNMLFRSEKEKIEAKEDDVVESLEKEFDEDTENGMTEAEAERKGIEKLKKIMVPFLKPYIKRLVKWRGVYNCEAVGAGRADRSFAANKGETRNTENIHCMCFYFCKLSKCAPEDEGCDQEIDLTKHMDPGPFPSCRAMGGTHGCKNPLTITVTSYRDGTLVPSEGGIS